LIVIIITSLVLVVGWSAAGWNVRGVEVWTHILVGSSTFLIGILYGASG